MRFLKRKSFDTVTMLESTLDWEDQCGVRRDLKLNNVQRKLIQHIECNQIIMVSSSRRTGITTALLLWIGAEMTNNVGTKFYFITHNRIEAKDCENCLISILFALNPTISQSLYNAKIGRVEHNDGYVVFTNRVPKYVEHGVNVVINNAAFINFETSLTTLADYMYPMGQALRGDGKLVVCSCFNPNATKNNEFEHCFFNHTFNNALDFAARLRFNWATNGDKDREWFLKQCELLNWDYRLIQTEINGEPICKLK